MKKLLSYVWPLTTKVKSDYNGILELTLVNGRKILDSKHANYSFGSLQRILEKGVSRIDLKNVDSILLLGLGGGSIITSLKERFGYKGKIHAIEIDQKIIGIAEKEFNIFSSDNLIIENVDAFDFVLACKSKFDLVIVDLFIDNEVPAQFYTNEFCTAIANLLKEKSAIIFNLGIDDVKGKGQNQVISFFKGDEAFNFSILENVEGSNTLLFIEKNFRKDDLI